MIGPLKRVLSAVGKPVETLALSDGGTALILPHGGRVLGLFARGSDENFFWTHPALGSDDSAGAFYRSGEWQNSGGDRTWLAPEADFFFPDFPDTGKYFQPRALDPGDFHLSGIPDGIRLVNRFECTLSRSKRKVDLILAKSVTPAPNPLRYERDLPASSDIEYAGYNLRTSLDVLGADAAEAPPIGLWNLLQMPHGGDMLVPVYSRIEPRVLFGSVVIENGPDDGLTAGDRLIRWRMRAAGDHKIGVRAVDTTGRAGYLYPAGRRWALIVRNFFVDPSGEYVDVPWTDTGDLGYSVQACGVNSAMGRFSELEYHVPAVGRGTGRTRCEDVCGTWAFRGPREPILAIARRLLSPDV
jgi:hypothetical protein